MMENTEVEEAREFSMLIKKLSREKQEGLYLLIKGAAVMAGVKEIFE